MADMDAVIARNIAEQLRKQNKKQVELAEGIGVAKPVITKILNGSRMVNAVELHRIADYFNITMDELVSAPKATQETNVVRAFMGRVNTEAAREALAIADELADMIIFHANVMENAKAIIQDDIFHIIQNYAARKETPLEFLRYPIDDEELCACTFVRGGRIFVLLNSKLPLCKQIFAVPYKAIVLRLYEEGLISESRVKTLFEVEASDVRQQIKRTRRAKRWIEPLVMESSFGGLDEYLAVNKENDSLIPSRLECDERRLQELRKKLNANTGTSQSAR